MPLRFLDWILVCGAFTRQERRSLDIRTKTLYLERCFEIIWIALLCIGDGSLINLLGNGDVKPRCSDVQFNLTSYLFITNLMIP